MSLPIFRLDEVAEVAAGNPAPQEPADFVENGYLFIRMQDVGREHHTADIRTSTDKISTETISKYRLRLFPSGSVLIPKSGASVNLNHRAMLGCDAYVVSHLAVVVPNLERLLPEYLYLWSLSYDPRSQAQTTSLPSLPLSLIKAASIPVPTIEKQRRIVDILFRANGIVRLRRDAEKKAAELISALFLDMFGDPAANPKGWPVSLLKDLVSFMSGGTPSKAREDFWQGDLPWVSPKDMKQAYISDAIDHVSRIVLAETNIKLVPIGSLLIVVRGMILVHTVPVAQSLIEHTINQDMKALFPVLEINVGYLLWLMKVSQPQLLGLVTTAAHGTKKLDTERLENFRIPLPPLEMQVAFSEKVAQIESIHSQQSAATAKAQATFDALLFQMFVA